MQSATYSALLADGAAGGGVHMAAPGEQGAEAAPPARRQRMAAPSARAPHTLGQVRTHKTLTTFLHLHGCSLSGCTAKQGHFCISWGPVHHHNLPVLQPAQQQLGSAAQAHRLAAAASSGIDTAHLHLIAMPLYPSECTLSLRCTTRRSGY